MDKGDTQSCLKCGDLLPYSSFEQMKSGNFRTICAKCRIKMHNILRSKSPYLFLQHLWRNLKHNREKSMDQEWKLTVDNLMELWIDQKGQCALSGINMTWKKGENGSDFNVSIDRIVAAGPYEKMNVQLVCYRVNMMKHTLPDNELYWWCKNIVAFKEKNINDIT